MLRMIGAGRRAVGAYVRRRLRKDRFPESLMEHLRTTRTNCVLDVGANHGQYGDYLRSLGYQGFIISFEPVAASFRLLEERARPDPKWRVHRMALGQESGDFPINLLPRSDFNSFRTPNAFGVGAFERIAPAGTEFVPIRPLRDVLDNCLAGIESPRLFLKTDTQGFDLEVLRGVGDRASELTGIQAEVPVTPIYEEVPSLVETLNTYAEFGFEAVSFKLFSWSDNLLVEMDALFRNTHLTPTKET